MVIARTHITLRTVLKVCVSLLLAGLIVWYVLFQARLLIAGPEIHLDTVPPVVEGSRTVDIRGTASNIVDISLNGRPIRTDESGAFNESLVLENGYTIMTLKAKDRYGREATLTHSFVYHPTTTTSIN